MIKQHFIFISSFMINYNKIVILYNRNVRNKKPIMGFEMYKVPLVSYKNIHNINTVEIYIFLIKVIQSQYIILIVYFLKEVLTLK